MHKTGRFRGEKIRYQDGVGCCIWIPFDEEESGICFDFLPEDIDDIIALLQKLKHAKAEEYEE